jgi:hypothetical protein
MRGVAGAAGVRGVAGAAGVRVGLAADVRRVLLVDFSSGGGGGRW